MTTGKVHVYIKPKTDVATGPIGVIKTSAMGEVLDNKTKAKKEEKEIDNLELKEIVEKTFSPENGAQKKKRGRKSKLANEQTVDSLEKGPMEQSAKSLDDGALEQKDDGGVNPNLAENNQEHYASSIHQLVHEQEHIDGIVQTQQLSAMQEQMGSLAQPVQINYAAEPTQKKEEPQLQIQLDPYISQNEPSKVMEAALFMAGQGVDNSSLGRLVGIAAVSQVQKMMQALATHYEEKGSAIEIVQDNGKWAMRVRQNYAPAVRQFAGEAEISTHSLKTLAFISKNNGITKRDLFRKLGSAIYVDVAELEEKGFVELVPLGRTNKVIVTSKFKQYFGV
ncbi:MAG: SMC-Scp complex subunit ScpB [Candidatus Micrarchaeia archaeon]